MSTTHERLSTLSLNVKHLHDSIRKLHETSQNVIRDTQNECNRLDEAHKKVFELRIMLRKQGEVLASILSYLKSKHREMLEEIVTARIQGEDSLRELELILERLSGVPLHRSFMDDIESSMKDATSLYDFVNVEGVADLRKRSFDQIQLLQSKQSDLALSLDPLEAFLHEIILTLRSDDVAEDRRIHFETHAWTVKQQMLSMDLAESLQLITRWLNQVRHWEKSIGPSSTITDSTIQKELDTMERGVSEVSKEMPRLESMGTEIVDTLKRVSARLKDYGEVFKELIGAYEKSESLGTTLREKVMEAEELSKHLQSEDTMITHALETFQEVDDLVQWYRHFLFAYDELPLELERRQRERNRMRVMIENMQKKLDDLHVKEEKIRFQFQDQFGRFLPSQICPFLQIPPERCKVTCDGTDVVVCPQKPSDIPIENKPS
eukprot:TRINITY_DN1988_c0_g1_i3.p1 TRINITY_DN1988_c0_g1~~TRINITY_DN1988_c0_g1_i3.p1  ORF type:complete len:435 (+),score=128.33 TRINITY_DN1988_c0_g1_i3:132-1436(+)